MLPMRESVLSLNEKNNTTLVFLLSNCPQVLKIFYDWPIKYYFDDFCVWLLGYRIELSWQTYIRSLEMRSTDEYVKKYWAKVHL